MKRFLGVLFLSMLAVACGPTYPNCNNDEQCHENEFCVNGHCQACRDDSNCAAGQRCAAGACEAIPGYCANSGACSADEECVNNRCQRRPAEASETPVVPPGACQLESVFYDFDESTLSDSARRALEANGQCITSRSIARVTITGMTDPRGTEEYNLALGDRRARAARDHLQRLGVSATMQTHSVGEEMAGGADESSWSRDRRAEFQER